VFAGIIAGLLILHDFSFPTAIQDLGGRLWQTSEIDTLLTGNIASLWYPYICAFLLVLAIMVTMLSYSGGAHAYGNFVMKYLKKSQHAEKASLLLSLFFCVDDYFSSLTVGCVMQPVTDRFKIARVKLALLVNGMAAPLAVVFPISSWVAEIMMQLRQSGVGPASMQGSLITADLFPFYIAIIPFIAYAFLVIGALWLLVISRKTFGILRKHEDIAAQTSNLFAGKMPLTRRFINVDPAVVASASLCDFLLPIGVLFFAVFSFILYFGNWAGFGGSHSLVLALQKSNTAAALFFGACIALLFSLVFFLARKRLQFSQIPKIFSEGSMLMLPSILTLVLIWTLSNILKGDLATGSYLASLLVGSVKIAYLPALFFVVAAITSTAMGSAWGTIGIYVPIAVPMIVSLSGVIIPATPAAVPLLLPLIGAIISGAIVGNHLSPISDTMLMASTSSGTYHIDLVRAQLAFTLPVVAVTVIAFIVSGMMMSAHWSPACSAVAGLAVGAISLLGLTYIIGCCTHRK
jgi:Na+/H+ antiporter NhaC